MTASRRTASPLTEATKDFAIGIKASVEDGIEKAQQGINNVKNLQEGGSTPAQVMQEAVEVTTNNLSQSYKKVALGKGSTGRIIPNNLREQLAMQEVLSNQLEKALELRSITMTDQRWLAQDGWKKMSRNINGIEIHFVYNPTQMLFDDFKFKSI